MPAMSARTACVSLVTMATVVGTIGRPERAEAGCPTTPHDPVCRPWSAVLMPTAFGATYSPRGEVGTYVGGGVEMIAMAWSDNSEAFGPSQGRVRLDVGLFDGLDDRMGALVMYRGGTQVSFERNAGRGFGIPYFVADLGGMWADARGRTWFADGGLGLYLVHRRNLILDLEATAVLPFTDVSELAGIRARLALSVSLW